MKFHSLLILCSVLLTGCKPDVLGPAPIDVEKVSLVLTELQIAESLKAEVPSKLRDSMQTVYQDNVLADHGLTRASFDSLMWIVRKEPEWVVEVFTLVNDNLARINADEKRIPDEVEEKQ